MTNRQTWRNYSKPHIVGELIPSLLLSLWALFRCSWPKKPLPQTGTPWSGNRKSTRVIPGRAERVRRSMPAHTPPPSKGTSRKQMQIDEHLWETRAHGERSLDKIAKSCKVHVLLLIELIRGGCEGDKFSDPVLILYNYGSTARELAQRMPVWKGYDSKNRSLPHIAEHSKIFFCPTL